MLFGDDPNSEVKFEINQDYANKYDVWRKRDELDKLKDRYEEFADESTSLDEEDPAELTKQFDKNFFKIFSHFKQRDLSPEDYERLIKDASSSEKEEKPARKKEKSEKPMFLKDYERNVILERDGKFSEDEDAVEKPHRSRSPTAVEQEKQIKESFKSFLEASDDEDDANENWGKLFQKRQKTVEEKGKEDEDYWEWLKGQKEELSDKKTESELKYLRNCWSDPNLDDTEKFLKDYILNKRFLEDKDVNGYIPTYEEIIHDSDNGLSADEETFCKQEDFEKKFNFRFEEPDTDFIKRYPRTMEHTLRKKNEKRKKKREELKAKKEAEAIRKREELKRYKALKRNEIMEKIEKLKLITGNKVVGFKDEDLEGDFDPMLHDRMMQQVFDGDYYGDAEEKKPYFPDIDEELEIENWNAWEENAEEYEETEEYEENGYEPHCEDKDFNMDCDYDPRKEMENEVLKSMKRKRKGKKWSKFAKAVLRKKPVFDPSNKSFEEYFDEYYKLDYEDIIGDLPCRFKYRNVIPNNFGLSFDEILKAEDKELNQWCSLKKAVQHRPEHIEKYDVKAYRMKAQNINLKRKVFLSLHTEKVAEESEETEESIPVKKKRKKEKQSVNMEDISKEEEQIVSDQGQNTITATADDVVNNQMPQPKKKKKKKNKSSDKNHVPHPEKNISKKSFRKHRRNDLNSQMPESNNSDISNVRLKAYGINPKKYRNKLKYGNK